MPRPKADKPLSATTGQLCAHLDHKPGAADFL
jgi:hypothetical protein